MLKVNNKFELIGWEFKEDMNFNATNETINKKYIDGTSTILKSHNKFELDFNEDEIESEEVIEHILSIGRELKTGNDAESEFVKVYTDREGKYENTYYAEKIKVAIQVLELNKISGTFLGIGDPIIGTVTNDRKTKNMTFTEGFISKN